MIPLDQEDFWYIYNLILPEDAIKCKTSRKVKKETKTGSISASKHILQITLKIVSINYFPS